MNVRPFQIVVSLGTDHHRFDRLVQWVDHWLGLYEVPPATLVQHGFSSHPQRANGVGRMPREELLALYRDADLVIVQGGPGSILDAREAGHIPVVVPRIPQLREVVDGHQVAFAAAMQQRGEARVASTVEGLINLGEEILRDPGTARTLPRIPNGAPAATRLERVVVDTYLPPTPRIRLRRIRQTWLSR